MGGFEGDADGERRPRESADDGPAGSLRRVQEWVVVDGDRLLVAAGFSLVVFVGLLGLDAIGVVAFLNDDSVTRMASGMVAGAFSLVTLVVSINQLILSREFTTADEYGDKLDGVLDFRRDVEAVSGAPVAPAEPSLQFVVLLEAIDRRARALETLVADHDDEAFRTRVEAYVDAVSESTAVVGSDLEGADYGTFEVLAAVLAYDDARQIYAARRLRDASERELSADVEAALDDVLDVLRLFKIAREHLKTRYLQHELTRFSQLTVYAGVPAVLAAAVLGFLYADVGGAAIVDAYLPYVASALVAVVALPLGILAAYILRTAAIGHRTAAIAPLLPAGSPERDPYTELADEGSDRE